MQDWQRALTTQVVNNVEHYRRLRGLHRTELAARCTALGLPTKRPALAALLDGRRQTITLQQVLVLAEALEVSMAELLLPLHDGRLAVTGPTRTEHPFPAATRLLGLAADGSTGTPSRPYVRYLQAVDRFARANRRLADLSHRLATGTLTPHQQDGRPHPASEILAAEAALSRLIDARNDLANSGITPPPVDADWPFLTSGPPDRRLPVLDASTRYPLYRYDLRVDDLPHGHLVTGPPT